MIKWETKGGLARLKIDCSQTSIFSYFYSIVERAGRIATPAGTGRENWTPAQNGSIDGVGGRDRDK